MAQALDQTAHHHQRHGGVFREAAGKVRPAEQQHIGLHLGPHRGRMRLVVDDAHLADVVARPQRGQNHLAAPAVGRATTRALPVSKMARALDFALLHQHLTALVALLVTAPLITSACVTVSSENNGTLRSRSGWTTWLTWKTSPQQNECYGTTTVLMVLTITTIENGLFL